LLRSRLQARRCDRLEPERAGVFRILLNDVRLSLAAFIAETPIYKPGDGRKNVDALQSLVQDS
jgi:hypothetical protein